MKALILREICDLTKNKNPLELAELAQPIPKENEILIDISTCGICHTELDEIEGRTPPPFFPMILGHQVVGKVIERGKHALKHKIGNRVGVAWIFSACGKCDFCLADNENLCADFKATGRDAFGGYAEFMTLPEDFAFPIPDVFTDSEAAPLLCAGAIGYRSLRLSNLVNGQNLGLTGFGASGHLVLKMVKHRFPDSRIFVFARSKQEQQFARDLGANWAGDTEDKPPEKLNCIIDTTPAWKPIVEAMKNLKPSGRLVVNAIRKEEIDKEYLIKLNYTDHLWMEKEIKSVANVTCRDVTEFIKLAGEIHIKPEIQEYSLKDANKAIIELKKRKIRGAKVIKF